MWQYTYGYSSELYHHGILGQKWGIRRFQNYDGTLIKKGTVVRRVSVTEDDPNIDNKKYVSINKKDHAKWEKLFGEGYLDLGYATYNQKYKVTNDLKVWTAEEQGKAFVEAMLSSNDLKHVLLRDIKEANAFFNGIEESDDPKENISRTIAAQTETGKRWCEWAKEHGYNAIFDTHGTDTADNPIIVLDPDRNLKKIGKASYTKPVKDYLRKT